MSIESFTHRAPSAPARIGAPLDTLSRWLRAVRIGLILTAVAAVAAIGFEVWQGPLYGAWGWPELMLTLCILIVTILAALENLLSAPNPYSRTHVHNELRDVAPHTSLDSGGSGWLIQAIPLTAAALLIFAWLIVA